MFLDKTGSSDFLHGIHDFANTFCVFGQFWTPDVDFGQPSALLWLKLDIAAPRNWYSGDSISPTKFTPTDARCRL